MGLEIRVIRWKCFEEGETGGWCTFSSSAKGISLAEKMHFPAKIKREQAWNVK